MQHATLLVKELLIYTHAPFPPPIALGNDFEPPDPICLIFNAGITSKCFTITTIDDEVLEGDQNFQVSAESTDVVVSPSPLTLAIEDNEGMCVCTA